MPRDSTHFDRAAELADELHAALRLPPADLLEMFGQLTIVGLAASVESHLAIAEALRGTVYVANANAV